MGRPELAMPRRGRRPVWRVVGVLGVVVLAAAVAGGWCVGRRLRFDAPEAFFRQKGDLAAAQLRPAAGDSSYDAFAVRLRSSAGYIVRGHLRVPRARGVWPGLIVIGGVRTGRMAAELINPETPYVILGLDYPWDGSTQPSALEVVIQVLDIREAMLLTPSAVMLAMDYLETRPDVADSGTVLVGASFGAQLIIVAGALDERAGPVLAIYGGGDFERLIEANLEEWPGVVRRPVASIAGSLLEPVEPLRYAHLIAPRPLILINGREDDRIPRESVERLYRAAGEPKRLIWLPEGHISSRNEALLGRVLEAAVRALGELAGRERATESGGRPF